MKNLKGNKAIKRLASQMGVSNEEIRREIQAVIDMGIANPDPRIQGYWIEMLINGVKPTPESIIEYLAKEVKSLNGR